MRSDCSGCSPDALGLLNAASGAGFCGQSVPQMPGPQPACLDQCFSFGREPRSSGEMPQFGKICAMECAPKAGLCRRFSRRMNMILRKNPVKAPRNASVIERVLKVRRPWPVRRNPVYAIATVQRIARTFMGPSHPVEFTILSQLARVAERCLKGNLSDGNLHISYTRRMTVRLSSD